MRFPFKIPLYVLFLVLPLLLVAPVRAATVQAVKGKRVIIAFNGEKVQKGEVYYVVRDGKRIGLVKIQTVKGKKALANLGKGRAAKGDSLTLRAAKAKADAKPTESKTEAESDSISEKKEKYWGFAAGLNQSAADVDLQDSSGNSVGKVSLDGMGYSVKGLIDYPLFSIFWFRGLFGIEQLVAGGKNNSQCSGECDIDISYVTTDFWGRATLSSTKTWWAGAGFNLLFPLSKSSSALDNSSITNTSILAIGGGKDYMLASGAYIPIQFEYGMYPESDQVKATAMVIRVGYAKKW